MQMNATIGTSRDIGEEKKNIRSRPYRLDGKLEFLALKNLGVINVKEVAVENSLNDSGNNGDPIKFIRGLHEVSIDPVRNIQSSVASKSEEVVCGNGFGLASPLKHKKLWQNGYRFKPDGKGPEDLGESVLVRDENAENSGAGQEILHAKGVDVGIVRGLVCVGHEVDNVALGANECNLEEQVVPAACREYVCVHCNVSAIVKPRLEGRPDDYRGSKAYRCSE